jgi:hypothetical protein
VNAEARCTQPIISSGTIPPRRTIRVTSERQCGKRRDDPIHAEGAHLFDCGGRIGDQINHAFQSEPEV